MIYIILVCLYSYLIIRLLLSVTDKGKDISKKFGPKVSILEIFIIAIAISYLFSYYYFQQTEFDNFIIPQNLIWIAFSSSILLLGIGIGVRYTLNLLNSFVDEKQVSFGRNKDIYDVFSQVWVNLSMLIIFFTYALMEISKPVERISGEINIFIVYLLSFGLGFLFYFFHKEIHFFVKKTTIISMVIISLCLSLFIFESKIDFIRMLPITTSFIIFNIAFFTTLLIRIRMKPGELREIEEDVTLEDTVQNHGSPRKHDIVLNFGNTSILTKSENTGIKIPTHNLASNTSPAIKLTHDRNIEATEINFVNSDNLRDDSKDSFSLRDLKLN